MPADFREAILRRARRDLVLTEGRERGDSFLWEHSVRVAENAERIACICQHGHNTRHDAQALQLASLYHDAGWAVEVRSGVVTIQEVLTRPTSPEQRELAASLISQRGADLVSSATLHRARQVVTFLNHRDQPTLEGQYLVAAETLDEVGLLSLWSSIRKQMLEGRDVASYLTQCRRQIEYKFWEARINETIRFEWIREVARQRLAELVEFLDRVTRLHSGLDIADACKKTPA